jgi:hypothetical protein
VEVWRRESPIKRDDSAGVIPFQEHLAQPLADKPEATNHDPSRAHLGCSCSVTADGASHGRREEMSDSKWKAQRVMH